jgi:hypothetical protein
MRLVRGVEPRRRPPAYRSAGIVLRCPVCGDVAMRIATLPERHIVQLAGSWTLSLSRPD